MGEHVEIWFQPSGGNDAEPLLLEARPFDPDDDPPATFDLDGVTLLAANVTVVQRGGDVVHVVDVVDPEYGAPRSVPVEAARVEQDHASPLGALADGDGEPS